MLVNESILKEHLGGIQTKLNLGTVVPFIKAAEFEFQNQIGKEMFKKLPNYPESTNEDIRALETELKYWAYSAISWLAYDMAVPHLKIRFGDMGMMKTSPANAVAITKWEYVDTRESNMAMADLAIKNFYLIIEELKPNEWTASDEFKLRNSLFINSPQMLSKYVVLAGDNIRLFSKILVYIQSSEELVISEVITEGVFNDLKAKLAANATLTLLEKKLLEHIRKALAPIAIQEASPYLQLKVDEDGMREIRKKDGIKEEEIAEKGRRNKLIVSLDNTSSLYLSRLRKFMDDNSTATIFPTYYTENLLVVDTTEYYDFTNKPHVIL